MPLFGMFRSSNTCCTALYCYARSALRWSISRFVGIMTWPSDTLAGTVVTPRRFRVLLRCWPVQPGRIRPHVVAHGLQGLPPGELCSSVWVRVGLS